MANVCLNELTITGSNQYLDSLFGQVVSKKNKFDFNNVIKPEKESHRKKEWGTISNSIDTNISRGSDFLLYKFKTHWNPPIGVLNKLVEKHPDLDFELVFTERLMQVAGFIKNKTCQRYKGRYSIEDVRILQKTEGAFDD